MVSFHVPQVYIHLANQLVGMEQGIDRRRDLLLRAKRCVERAIHQLSPGGKDKVGPNSTS